MKNQCSNKKGNSRWIRHRDPTSPNNKSNLFIKLSMPENPLNKFVIRKINFLNKPFGRRNFKRNSKNFKNLSRKDKFTRRKVISICKNLGKDSFRGFSSSGRGTNNFRSSRKKNILMKNCRKIGRLSRGNKTIMKNKR